MGKNTSVFSLQGFGLVRNFILRYRDKLVSRPPLASFPREHLAFPPLLPFLPLPPENHRTFCGLVCQARGPLSHTVVRKRNAHLLSWSGPLDAGGAKKIRKAKIDHLLNRSPSINYIHSFVRFELFRLELLPQCSSCNNSNLCSKIMPPPKDVWFGRR